MTCRVFVVGALGGFALARVVRWSDARPEQCFLCRTHTGAEFSLLDRKVTVAYGSQLGAMSSLLTSKSRFRW